MKIMTDSPIRFPGLFGDWTITLSSKAINIGNGIYWYGILIALGMLVALWWCMRQRTKYGIIGARIYYVLFYLSQFKDHEGRFSWSKAIAIWDGGLAIYGGVMAVVIVAIILDRVTQGWFSKDDQRQKKADVAHDMTVGRIHK